MLVLYDLENKERLNWSPNTFKPRPVLAYKNIPYQTEWISYPDIDKKLRSHGQESASPVTVPVLVDGQDYIVDSWEIAQYLEKKVPSPTIFPNGFDANEKFHEYYKAELQPVVLKWIIPFIPPMLDDRGAEYFIRTREQRFGCSLTEYSKGSDDSEHLPVLRGKMTPVFHALRASGSYIMGEFGYADCLVLAVCQFVLRCNSGKFEKFLDLDGDGNFRKWYQRCSPYYKQMN